MQTNFILYFIVLPVALLSIPCAAQDRPSTIYHDDYRKTPKFDFVPYTERAQPRSTRGLEAGGELTDNDKRDIARDFLSNNAATYELPPDLATLKFASTQPTLTGTLVRFQQTLLGLDVIGAEVVVSIDKEGTVADVRNGSFPMPASWASGSPAAPKISRERALEIALVDDLKANSSPAETPVAALKYLVTENKFRLVWELDVSSQDRGYWRYVVDAKSGEIVSKFNRSSPGHKRGLDPAELERDPEDGRGQGTARGVRTGRRSLSDLLESLEHGTPTAGKAAPIVERAEGTALVFDPDPVTKLKDRSLADNSPGERFNNAYVSVTLKDLAKVDGKFRLEGPWVEIKDFSGPEEPPSVSNDGTWRAKRGESGFDDVMAYYHIDKSQRYLQSLGYTGQLSIAAFPIQVDTFGFPPDVDNSDYVFASRRLRFGRGCVDDAEDADVVLHEYGHAITDALSPNVFVSSAANPPTDDSGAIGEGFGDYWAASQGLADPAIQDFEPDVVFNWDSADSGTGKRCWSGRVFNASSISYTQGVNHGPHIPMPGGRFTDELWSTPLHRTLQELMQLGRTRNEVDTIVLESMRGLVSGLRMPQLAELTVRKACELFPNGPHGDVFLKHFRSVGILDKLSTVSKAGSDSAPPASATPAKVCDALRRPGRG